MRRLPLSTSWLLWCWEVDKFSLSAFYFFFPSFLLSSLNVSAAISPRRRSTPEHSNGIEGSQEEPEQFGLIAQPLLNIAKRPPWTQFCEPPLYLEAWAGERRETVDVARVCAWMCARTCVAVHWRRNLSPMNHPKICAGSAPLDSTLQLGLCVYRACLRVCPQVDFCCCCCCCFLCSSVWLRGLLLLQIPQLWTVTLLLRVNERWWSIYCMCPRSQKASLSIGTSIFTVSHLMKMHLSHPSCSLSLTVFVAGKDQMSLCFRNIICIHSTFKHNL